MQFLDVDRFAVSTDESVCVTNVIIMLNLLISILGEAYEKSQMTIRENDMHQMLTLILEYEHMMIWRRCAGRETFMVLCESTDRLNEGEEWEGLILSITNALKQDSARIETKLSAINDNVSGVKSSVEGESQKSELRLDAIEQKCATVDKRLVEVESALESMHTKTEDVHPKVTGLETMVETMEANLGARIGGVETKVGDIQAKLETVLSLLQART